MFRTGFSFRTAIGHLPDVIARLQECGWYEALPIADRNSTFGYVKWAKLAKAKKARAIFGVELAVTKHLGAAKPIVDYWTFLAKSSLRPLHDLVNLATRNSTREPLITYDQAMAAEGLFRIAGPAALLDNFASTEDMFIGLSPATPYGLFKAALERGHRFFAKSDNVYPRAEDLELYRMALGWRAETTTYPRHILTDGEWHAALSNCAGRDVLGRAITYRNLVLSNCLAELKVAELLKPKTSQTLREMCVDGAAKLNCDLNDLVYAERLERELNLIREKKFEDYFFILADLISYAKQHMIVGPARGSSCGSLVCYLIGITAIDPIPYGLIFERFIDINRSDLPDIDVDFADDRRDMVFAYAEQRYGADRVARLGTVSLFKPRSALKQAGGALRIPTFMVERALEGVIERSGGDSRAMMALEDTLKSTEMGRRLVAEFPNAMLAAKLEGHPDNASQHAAGIVLTEQPIAEYVAVDARTNAAMCDKKDAEELNLLKIDALGLTQLAIFQRCLELMGQPGNSAAGFLEGLPLDDQKAFEVLNSGKFSGIFQFTGTALKSLCRQVKVESLEDMIAMTALARPGPMSSGGTSSWAKRRRGEEQATTIHPLLTELTKETFGVVVYQEQVLRIVREMGKMSWADTSAIRKAMSGRLGDEFFEGYKRKFMAGALESGVEENIADEVWRHINTMGSWCLSGETRLINPFKSQFAPWSQFTLKELFDSGGYVPGTTTKIRKQNLFCLQGETIKPAELVEVIYSGKRETWEIEVDSGEKLRATMEHRFLCQDFKYRQLKELSSGDVVLLIGKTQATPRKAKKGIGQGGQNWWPKLKAGKPLFQRQLRKLRKIYKRCQNCKRQPYQETHHINMDHDDHSWENLLPVCRKCHRSFHKTCIPHSKGKSPREAKIISISSPLVEDTYDITMPFPHNNFVANDFIVHNSFNRSHAVAYGIVSYWCCWLKAHHPMEFAAATLDAEKDPVKQLTLLRELSQEGINYVAVDPQHSTERWSFKKEGNKATLVGPLTMINGIGPAAMKEIIECRRKGIPLRAVLAKKLESAQTKIDQLWPIRAASEAMLKAGNVVSLVTPIAEIQPGTHSDVCVVGVFSKIAPKDENEAVNVMKRGGKVLSGPTDALNLFLRDDEDEIFCKVSRFRFNELGRGIIERGGVGKALYALKGTVYRGFRGIDVKAVRYLGEI